MGDGKSKPADVPGAHSTKLQPPQQALLEQATKPYPSGNAYLKYLDKIELILRFIFVKLPVIIWTGRKPYTNFIFRVISLGSLISLGYLVADRIYETSATILSPASDPSDPFYFPFSLTNLSHIFPLRNVDWACQLIDVKYEGNSQVKAADVIERVRKPILQPGGVSNIYCNRNGIKFIGIKMNSATVRLQAEYDVDIFSVYLWRKRSELTYFTWMPAPTESRRQWIKGDP